MVPIHRHPLVATLMSVTVTLLVVLHVAPVRERWEAGFGEATFPVLVIVGLALMAAGAQPLETVPLMTSKRVQALVRVHHGSIRRTVRMVRVMTGALIALAAFSPALTVSWGEHATARVTATVLLAASTHVVARSLHHYWVIARLDRIPETPVEAFPKLPDDFVERMLGGADGPT